MQSYTVRKKNGVLEGPYNQRVIQAFIISGKLKEDDVLLTPEGDIPLRQHPDFRDRWEKPKPSTNPPAMAKKAAAPLPKGRVVFFKGKVLPPGPNPNYAGSLAKNPLIFSMYKFVLSQQTGRLHLRRGRETIDIFLEHGTPVYAVSNQLDTRLAELAVSEKVIPREKLSALLQRATEERCTFGQLLLRENYATPTQLQALLLAQFKKRIFTALSWRENAVYRFYKGQITGAQFPIHITPWVLLKEAALEGMPISYIDDALLPFRNRQVIRQIHPKLKLSQFELAPRHVKFIEGITQQDPVNDVVGDAVERGILPEEEAHRVLFLMWQVEFLRMDQELIGARTQRQLKDLRDYIERLKQQSRLQRLNLKGGATPSEIRSSYIQLAKTYHPDHLPPGTHSEVAKVMSEAFSLIAEAYRILSNN